MVIRSLAVLLLLLISTHALAKDKLKRVNLEIRVDQNLGSDISHDRDRFTGTVNRQISFGTQIVRKGSPMTGVVKEAESTLNYSQPGLLELELTSVTAEGKIVEISTNTLRLQGRERQMNRATGQQDPTGARGEDATRAATGVVLGSSTTTAQTIPGTDIALGTSNKSTGMQVIVPKNSKLIFTVTSSD